MLEIFGHYFSSYTWKVLIPLYENGTEFTFRMIDENHPDNVERLQALSPQMKFPLLVEGDTVLFESTVIIEYLQQQHPGKTSFIPKLQEDALQVRMLDRFFDNYVMAPVVEVVSDSMREPPDRDSIRVEKAKEILLRSYTWLDERLQKSQRQHHAFICGDDFGLADCAAAPSLFYADWVLPIAPELTALREYRATLLKRPSIKRCVDDARPFRKLFPPGAPDRD